MPRDPNAPKTDRSKYEPYKYHIKGDPLGRAAFPKPTATRELEINDQRQYLARISHRGRTW